VVCAELPAIYQALRRDDWCRARHLSQALLYRRPDWAPAHHALGLALCGDGMLHEALCHLECAHDLEPNVSTWAADFAVVCAQLGRWQQCVDVLTPLLPDLAAPLRTLYLSAAIEAGCAERALRAIEQHLEQFDIGSDVELWCEYGRALHAAARHIAAEAVLLMCLQVAPMHARAHDLIAALYQQLNRGDLASYHWGVSATLQPDSGYAQIRMAVAYASRGRLTEARSARLIAARLGLQRRPDRLAALRLMLFDEWETPAAVLRASRDEFPARTCGARAARVLPAPDPQRRIRVGYLSGEFHSGPAVHFLVPFLAHHDRRSFEVFLYNSSESRDAQTDAFRQLGEHWREITDLPDESVKTIIEVDDLDVLIDLSGQFPGNRLPVFARRAARVQATFPNYPATTGCPEMDYVLTDGWTSPPGSDNEYSERLHRLASGYLVYDPPPESPPVGVAPFITNGYITFGLFQQLCKLNDSLWDCVADVLRQVPRSRLLVHNGDAELDRNQSLTAKSLEGKLSERGVDRARLTLVGPLPLTEHLLLLGNVDVAFDTWPYTGQTTTMECLWMGVPVITRAGQWGHASRVSASILVRSGCGELVARSSQAYSSAAVHLASRKDKLLRYRAGLRNDLAAGGLLDGIAQARGMEAAYREWISAWEREHSHLRPTRQLP
jgi:Flp pilus assembly protein TadD